MKRSIIFSLMLVFLMLWSIKTSTGDVIFYGFVTDDINDVEIYDNSQGLLVGTLGPEGNFLDVVSGGYALSSDMKFIEMNSTFVSTPIVNASIDYSMRYSILDDYNETANIREVSYSLVMTTYGNGNYASFTVYYKNGTQFSEEVQSFYSFVNSTSNTWVGNFSVDSILQSIGLDLMFIFADLNKFSTIFSVTSYMNVDNSPLYYTDTLIFDSPPSYFTNTTLNGTSTNSTSTIGPLSFEFFDVFVMSSLGVIGTYLFVYKKRNIK